MHCHQALCTLDIACFPPYALFLAIWHASLFSYPSTEQRPNQTMIEDGKHEVKSIVRTLSACLVMQDTVLKSMRLSSAA